MGVKRRLDVEGVGCWGCELMGRGTNEVFECVDYR